MRPGRGPPGLPALLRTQPDPRPAIAVLPFRTEDREAETEVASFASGMVEGIIHFLSGLKELFVISYSAVHAVGGTAFDPQAAGRALGVRYVLDGSVRRHQARLRVTTRLSETETGGILHAERHDAALSDLFDLQDSIAAQVATTIAPHVHERELARATRKHPDSMSAYELVIQGIEWLHRLDQQSFSQARGLLQRAMATDPAYAPAFSHAAWWHTFRIAQGWSPEPANDAGEALRLSAIAGGLDRSDALALTIQGHTQGFLLRDYEGGLDLLTRALGFAPSNALAWAFSSAIHGYMDHGNEAVTHAEQALRLSPLGPFVFLHQMILAQAYYLNGELDNAVSWGRRAVAQNQRHAPALRVLAASLAASGRHVETHAVAQTILQLNPKFNLTDYARSTPLQGAIRQGFVDHLRKAGLPG
jgi:TolB-like protein